MTLSGLLRLPLALLALATVALPLQADAGCVGGSLCVMDGCQGSLCTPDTALLIQSCTLRLCLPDLVGPCQGTTCVGTPPHCDAVKLGDDLGEVGFDTSCLIGGALLPTPTSNYVSWVLDLLPDLP